MLAYAYPAAGMVAALPFLALALALLVVELLVRLATQGFRRLRRTALPPADALPRVGG